MARESQHLVFSLNFVLAFQPVMSRFAMARLRWATAIAQQIAASTAKSQAPHTRMPTHSLTHLLIYTLPHVRRTRTTIIADAALPPTRPRQPYTVTGSYDLCRRAELEDLVLYSCCVVLCYLLGIDIYLRWRRGPINLALLSCMGVMVPVLRRKDTSLEKICGPTRVE